jgi:hypothetical protein
MKNTAFRFIDDPANYGYQARNAAGRLVRVLMHRQGEWYVWVYDPEASWCVNAHCPRWTFRHAMRVGLQIYRGTFYPPAGR